jgi:hypothetical protein
MKWLNGYNIRLVSVGFVAAIVSGGGGKVYGDLTFGRPVNLGRTINSENSDWLPCISADGLEMYFSSNRAGGYGDQDIYVTTRSTADADWGPPVNLGPTVNGPAEDASAFISADGLTLYYVPLYFESGGSPAWDIWITRRLSKDADWGKPINLGPTLNSPSIDVTPSISNDGLELYFASNRSGGYGAGDLYVSTRVTTDSNWGTPMNLGPTINNSSADYCPFISSDGLALFFSSDNLGPFRPGGLGRSDIWVTMRMTVLDSWGPPVNLGPVINTSVRDLSPNISADGSTLYFGSDRPDGFGGLDLWQAPIIPLVDFNGDEKVDIQDLLRLIESWGKDDPSVDMGPMPWGDGKVDEKDLEVLMRYWQQEVLPVSLIAYWKLDEAGGIVAADKAGTNNATLVSNPIWQPAGGKLGGALQLDGIDDCVRTPFVVDPAQGPFSVFAWIQGGAPGQALLSQDKGANWLMARDPGGVLATDLKESGRKGKPLVSATVITDGAWHRIGFVWDGTHRTLYVDGAEAAKDTQANLPSSSGGLYIGAGSALAPGSFWKGLIDDVRIYDRAVKP